MNRPNPSAWKQISTIVTGSSRQTFSEIRPPATPILRPALFILSVSMLLWIVLYVFWIVNRYPEWSAMTAQLSRGFPWVSLVSLILMTILGYLSSIVVLSTYYFAIARYFRIEILWEHWFGFTCYTLVPMILVPSARWFIGTYGYFANPSLALCIVVLVLGLLLPIVWTVFITQLGLRIWTGKTRGYCVLSALVPYVLYGLSTIPDIVSLIARIT